MNNSNQFMNNNDNNNNNQYTNNGSQSVSSAEKEVVKDLKDEYRNAMKAVVQRWIKSRTSLQKYPLNKCQKSHSDPAAQPPLLNVSTC